MKGIIAFYENRPEVRSMFPMGITLSGMKAFLAYMVYHLQPEDGLSLLDVYSFFRTVENFPSLTTGLVYINQPEYQKLFPHALDDEVHWLEFLQFLKKTFRIKADWINDPSVDDNIEKPIFPGVNVLGHFCYPSGLQVAATLVADSFEKAGHQVMRRSIPATPNDAPRGKKFRSLLQHENTIIIMAPEPYFADVFNRAGVYSSLEKRTFAIWYWELEEAPAHWAGLTQGVQEIWAPTKHIQNALRNVIAAPVISMLPAITLPSFSPLSRNELGLKDDDFIFLFVFDLASIMERKNPLSLIRAFKLAFNSMPKIKLVLKVSRAKNYPEELKVLREAIDGANIYLDISEMAREKVTALMNSCDCYVSLHRAEGLGLTIAEAMLLGKPVIATAYSGNLDFMDADTSLLVKYDRVELDQDYLPYKKGWHWAAPDEKDAAEKMRWVYENPEAAKLMGEAAKIKLSDLLSPKRAGERMIERLNSFK
jgi:glycosyltransferase involved in cell wall biosynthesis